MLFLLILFAQKGFFFLAAYWQQFQHPKIYLYGSRDTEKIRLLCSFHQENRTIYVIRFPNVSEVGATCWKLTFCRYPLSSMSEWRN